MVAQLNSAMLAVATRSLETAIEIGRYVQQNSKPSFGSANLEDELAITVLSVFDRLAWSDGSLDRDECRVLEALIAVDPAFGGRLELASQSPTRGSEDIHWPYFRAVQSFDARENCHLGVIAIDSLESLGYAIIAANGRVLPAEATALEDYFREVRATLAEVTVA